MTLREIKNYITSSIYTNGLHGITASVMQKVLTEIVNFFSTKGVITESQTLTSSEQTQVRKNIGAVGVYEKSADKVKLRDSEGIVYPQSKAEYIDFKETNLETFAEMVLSRLQDLNTRVSNLEG